MSNARSKARLLAAAKGWPEGGYAGGPDGESKHGWIDPDGNVWSVPEMLAGSLATRPTHGSHAKKVCK